MENKPKIVELTYPPEFVLEYAHKLLEAAKKGRNNGPAELAMLTDICTMLEIAKDKMTPSQPDAGKDKD